MAERKQTGGKSGRASSRKKTPPIKKPTSVPRFTVKQVREALQEGITQLAAAKILHDKTKKPCARSTICTYVKRHPELREVYDQCRETLIDMAEDTLIRNLKAGKEASAIFIAKTLGRGRGYVERTELDHQGKTVLEVRLPESWGKDGGEECAGDG